MEITKKEIEKLCKLYCWLNIFLHQIDQEQLQKLEEEHYKIKNREAGLPRIQFELDTYYSLEMYFNKYPLSERQKILKEQMMFKKNKDIETRKVDTCQFLLELDSIDNNISMTSHLYTAYPIVYDRIHKDLLYLFEHETDKEIVDMIGKTLFDRKRFLYKQLKYLKSFFSRGEMKEDSSKSLTLKK